MAQIVVPIVKTIIVPKNSCRVVNHCNKTAEIGITTAITSMNPVAIHCTVGKEIWNSFINVVRAIFNNVSFKTAKKAPMINDSMIGKTFTLGSSAKNSYFFGSCESVIQTALPLHLFFLVRIKKEGPFISNYTNIPYDCLHVYGEIHEYKNV